MWYTEFDGSEKKDQTGAEVSKLQFLPDEDGQGLVEFALILVLIAIVVIAIYLLVEPSIGDIVNELKGFLGR